MADKLNELAGKFGKGGAPKGLGVGMKLLAVAAAGVYGLKESMYTGKKSEIAFSKF
jgi:prohibitin 2